jgi:PAS domain S-box-containing protein
VTTPESSDRVQTSVVGGPPPERSPTEDALRRHEELLGTVIDGAPIVIFGLDREGRFTLSEGKALSLLGLAPGQVVGMSAFELYAEVPEMSESLRRTLAGETVHFRSAVGPVWFEATYVPTRDATGSVDGVIGVAFDITEQVRAEQALRLTRDQLDATLHALPDLLFEVDAQGRLFGYHAKREELLQVPPEQFLGRTFHDVLPAEAADACVAAIEEAARNGHALGRAYRLAMPDGDRWFEPSVARKASLPGEGARFVLLARDVTDRVRAQEALRRSQSQLSEAQRIAQLGSWELDLRTNALSWSDEIFRIFEIDPRRFGASYDAFLAAIHPDDRELVNEAFRRSVARREPYQIVHRLLMADGRIKHVEERGETFHGPDGSPSRSVGTVQDITKERQAELSLQASEAQLEATLQAIPDLLFEVDRSGRYIAVRAQRSDLLAAPTAQLLGRSIRDVLPAEGAAEAERAIAEASAQGVSFGRTYRLALPDGEHWFELSIARRPDPGGRDDTYVVVSRDITERKKAENAMKRSLAEKSLLLREVHHRVKNNLQIVSSLLHLQGNKTTDPASRALFDESRERVRAIAMAHEFLSQSEDLSRIDFGAYVRTVTRRLVAAHAPSAAPLVVSVDADEGLLDIQIAIPCGLIANELLTNVLKYAFPGGRSGELRVAFGRSGASHWTLSVADDGIGLPEAVDPGAARTLGLKLVHTLATQIDATLRVDRSRGTRFELRFPG